MKGLKKGLTRARIRLLLFWGRVARPESNGDSPSGKALGSGPSIRGFESLIPSQKIISP